MKGFTLIELLVVVLIIGILAAVALPQYQRAVLKTRLTQSIIRVRSLNRAAEAYYMANGTYPTDVRDLDIDITAGARKFAKTDISSGEHIGVFYSDGSYCAVGQSGSACAARYFYVVALHGAGRVGCRGLTVDGDKVCRSLAGGQSGEDKGGTYLTYPIFQ